MRLTVLGGAAACPNPGQGCSAYLVEHNGTRVLLDCGPGTLSVLRSHIDFRAVDALIISHLHSDHTLDVVPYRYGLMYAPGRTAHRVPLWMPPGGAAFLDRLAGALAHHEEASSFFGECFAVAEYDPAATLEIGPFSIQFHPTQHFIPCWAMRLNVGGQSLVYLADSGPDPALAEFARDCDLLISEGTYLTPPDGIPPEQQGHMTARQAGELAATAGARGLLLTHLWAEIGLAAYQAEAETGFHRDVRVAVPGLAIDV